MSELIKTVSQTGLALEQCKIVDMRFVFGHKDMLILLEKRAKAISKKNIENVIKNEIRMDKLKSEKFSELTTPYKFYCTFEDVACAKKLN